KAKTAKGRRVLQAREPQTAEDIKTAIFLKGTTTSQTVSDALKSLYTLKKPAAVMFNKRNDIHPFDNANTFEFLSQRNNAPLFCMGMHSKKRPHNMVFVRTHGHQILDMVEMGLLKYEGIFGDGFSSNTRPLLTFAGDWNSAELQTCKSLLLDFFRGTHQATAATLDDLDQGREEVELDGIEHVISFTSDPTPITPTGSRPGDVGAIIYMRVYRVKLLKATVAHPSGQDLPYTHLEDMGPNMDFAVRRVQVAEPAVMNKACRLPKMPTSIKKQKNIAKDEMGDTVGRIHVEQQDLGKLQTRKMKGLKTHLDPVEHDGLTDDEEDRDAEDEDDAMFDADETMDTMETASGHEDEDEPLAFDEKLMLQLAGEH
ncbi:hypothetical protein CXG81DRAFT_10058, partial [Caulochytrium protostelioides]